MCCQNNVSVCPGKTHRPLKLLYCIKIKKKSHYPKQTERPQLHHTITTKNTMYKTCSDEREKPLSMQASIIWSQLSRQDRLGGCNKKGIQCKNGDSGEGSTESKWGGIQMDCWCICYLSLQHKNQKMRWISLSGCLFHSGWRLSRVASACLAVGSSLAGDRRALHRPLWLEIVARCIGLSGCLFQDEASSA